jgi:hypothetical protein
VITVTKCVVQVIVFVADIYSNKYCYVVIILVWTCVVDVCTIVEHLSTQWPQYRTNIN